MKTEQKGIYGLGIMVFVGLMALTIGEYYAATNLSSTALLFVIALFKAALILEFFMHMSSLWSKEDSH